MEKGNFEGFDGISAEELFTMGQVVGFAAAAFVAGFLRGQKDYNAFAEQAAGHEETPPAEEPEGGVCAQCWCNTCAKLDVCDAFAASDDLRPVPCAECNRTDEAPIMPRARPAECGTYQKTE